VNRARHDLLTIYVFRHEAKPTFRRLLGVKVNGHSFESCLIGEGVSVEQFVRGTQTEKSGNEIDVSSGLEGFDG
jgi:hypothetical protein